ncbi:MAG: helix-turn-helix domain-containing protein [Bacteroidales bacterium]|nr:helix-turn-helix domain-containing protein [Bacteroidales bacterium]
MNRTVFEAHGEELIARAGMTKAEFARRMGIQRQNVKSLFRSPKLETVQRTAIVLNLPLEYLIGYVNPVDFDEEPFSNVICEPDFQYIGDAESDESLHIRPEDIPTGNSVEEMRTRKKLIWRFYEQWKTEHPELSVYNNSIKENINIRHISIEETSGHASLTYLSTLAVLQLDQILQNAKLVSEKHVKGATHNQRMFTKIILMEHYIVGIGRVKLTVGVRRSDNTKVQYCITAIESGI